MRTYLCSTSWRVSIAAIAAIGCRGICSAVILSGTGIYLQSLSWFVGRQILKTPFHGRVEFLESFYKNFGSILVFLACGGWLLLLQLCPQLSQLSFIACLLIGEPLVFQLFITLEQIVHHGILLELVIFPCFCRFCLSMLGLSMLSCQKG